MSDDQKTSTPTRELRIQHIESMMRDFTFERGKTFRDLAAKWGLAEQTVRLDTAEASKRIAAAVMDPESVNAAVGAALERALREAIAAEQWGTVAKLSETWSKISGSGAPERHEVLGSVVSPAAAAALVRQKFGEHAAKSDSGETSPDAGTVPDDTSGE